MNYKEKKGKSVNKNYDFHLSIGLVLSLVFVISAFEWKTEESSMIVLDIDSSLVTEVMIEIPITSLELPKPPKPKITSNPVEIPDEVISIETEIETVVSITSETVETKIVESLPEPPIDEPDFFAYERHASPLKGMIGFNKYVSEAIAKNLNSRHRQKEEIRAYITFQIQEDGSVGGFKIKGLDKKLSDVAIKAVKSYGKWEPARQQSHNVRENFNLPIKIKLK